MARGHNYARKREAYYSAEMQTMSPYWDDPYARVGSASGWRYAMRRARMDPFVFGPSHGPDAEQTGPLKGAEKEPWRWRHTR